jgi:hypothetical protein
VAQVGGGNGLGAARIFGLLDILNPDENVGGSGRNRRAENDPFFVPVTHVATSVNFVEDVALLGLATLLGVALTMLVEGMNRRLR